jgi:hypothetical protein
MRADAATNFAIYPHAIHPALNDVSTQSPHAKLETAILFQYRHIPRLLKIGRLHATLVAKNRDYLRAKPLAVADSRFFATFAPGNSPSA